MASADLMGAPATTRPQARPRGLLSAQLTATAVTLASLTAAILTAARSDRDLALTLAVALVTAAWLAAGWATGRRQERWVLGLLLVGAAVCGGVGLLGRALWAARATGSLAEALERSGQFADAVGSSLLFHAGVGFPDGHLRSIGRRLVVGAGYVLGVGAGLAAALHGYPQPELTRFAPIFTIGGGVVISAWYFRSRYLSAPTRQRQRMQWMAAAAAAVSAVAVLVVTANLLLSWPEPLALVLTVTSVVFPLALVTDGSRIAALRAERTASLALIALGWTLASCVVLFVFVDGFTHRPTAGERAVLVATLAAVATIGLTMPALRRHLHAGVHRLVFGDRPPHDAAVTLLASRLSRTARLDDLLHDLVDSLATSQGTLSSELWLAHEGWLERAISVPEEGPARCFVPPVAASALLARNLAGPESLRTWLPQLPLGTEDERCRAVVVAHRGELLGLIVLRRATSADDFVERDHEALADLARQLGLVIHNAQLDSELDASQSEVREQAAELRASRERLVATADAERQRIERDIHDGAQQQLVALAVGMELVRDLVEDDPTEAKVVLDELREELHTAIDDLRTLAHGIYPPLLAERGLHDALRALMLRRRPRVDVTVGDVGRHPAVVEAAVYFCCLEALQNAAKHAPDATVHITVARLADHLRFTVTDDGPGFDPATAATGRGRQNMIDRVGAIGGTITWRSAPGAGTCVEARLPLRPAQLK